MSRLNLRRIRLVRSIFLKLSSSLSRWHLKLSKFGLFLDIRINRMSIPSLDRWYLTLRSKKMRKVRVLKILWCWWGRKDRVVDCLVTIKTKLLDRLLRDRKETNQCFRNTLMLLWNMWTLFFRIMVFLMRSLEIKKGLWIELSLKLCPVLLRSWKVQDKGRPVIGLNLLNTHLWWRSLIKVLEQ